MDNVRLRRKGKKEERELKKLISIHSDKNEPELCGIIAQDVESFRSPKWAQMKEILQRWFRNQKKSVVSDIVGGFC